MRTEQHRWRKKTRRGKRTVQKMHPTIKCIHLSAFPASTLLLLLCFFYRSFIHNRSEIYINRLSHTNVLQILLNIRAHQIPHNLTYNVKHTQKKFWFYFRFTIFFGPKSKAKQICMWVMQIIEESLSLQAIQKTTKKLQLTKFCLLRC